MARAPPPAHGRRRRAVMIEHPQIGVRARMRSQDRTRSRVSGRETLRWRPVFQTVAGQPQTRRDTPGPIVNSTLPQPQQFN